MGSIWIRTIIIVSFIKETILQNMSLYIFFFIAILISAPEVIVGKDNPTATCEGDWFEVPDHGCFLINVETTRSWLDAQNFCEDNGGYLAEVIDEDIQETLTVFLGIYGGAANAWIGANDIGATGDWKWIHSGSNVTELFWATGYPNAN